MGELVLIVIGAVGGLHAVVIVVVEFTAGTVGAVAVVVIVGTSTAVHVEVDDFDAGGACCGLSSCL